MTVTSSGCPECGGTGARGCGAGWHDGKPDAPSPLDEPTAAPTDPQTVIAAWLANTDLIQPFDGWERDCENYADDLTKELRAAGVIGGQAAAPTRPTRERLWDVIAERWVAHGLPPSTTGEAFISEVTDAVMALIGGDDA